MYKKKKKQSKHNKERRKNFEKKKTQNHEYGVISLNINRLTVPSKTHRLAE